MPKKEITIIDQVSPIVAEAKGLKIKDAKSMEAAVLLLSRLNKENDRIEKDEKELTGPINEALKKIRDKYRPAKTILSEAIAYARKAIGDYQLKEDEKATKKQDAIAEKIASGKVDPTKGIEKMGAITRPDAVVSTAAGSVKFREVEKFEVLDIQKLPWEYLLPNETAIKEAMKKGLKLPGIRYYKEKVVVNNRA